MVFLQMDVLHWNDLEYRDAECLKCRSSLVSNTGDGKNTKAIVQYSNAIKHYSLEINTTQPTVTL